MNMWLQTRTVRHLVTGSPVRALCSATPAMWFDENPGRGKYVFDGPNPTAPADLTLPLCQRCTHALTNLNQAAR